MSRSQKLHAAAQAVIPGGVNSPVRAFKAVGGNPIYIASASGSRVVDVDGKEYIDCLSSWGPLLLGHAHPEVVEAICEAARGGTSYGAPTERELRLAETIVDAVPGVEKVRLVNSGTEATMSALRLARGATGRNKVIKFEGCYHGHADSFLIKAGSGATTLGQPSSPGVPAGLAGDTLTADYNDLESVDRAFEEGQGDVSCIIVEPVAGNMGVIPPRPGFLEGLRRQADDNGALLVFDEVITGFRLAFGGAQELYSVVPDLTTMGKVIGGGLPVGAFGGRAPIMDELAPEGSVYQAGTLSGNPLSVAAGQATLEILCRDNPYAELNRLSERLFNGLARAAEAAGINLWIHRVGSMGCAFFRQGEVWNYSAAADSDVEAYAVYHAAMLEQGIYLAPSQFEACFVSTAHSESDIDRILEAAETAVQQVHDHGVGRS